MTGGASRILFVLNGSQHGNCPIICLTLSQTKTRNFHMILPWAVCLSDSAKTWYFLLFCRFWYRWKNDKKKKKTAHLIRVKKLSFFSDTLTVIKNPDVQWLDVWLTYSGISLHQPMNCPNEIAHVNQAWSNELSFLLLHDHWSFSHRILISYPSKRILIFQQGNIYRSLFRSLKGICGGQED